MKVNERSSYSGEKNGKIKIKIKKERKEKKTGKKKE